jgi:hypothetical protein
MKNMPKLFLPQKSRKSRTIMNYESTNMEVKGENKEATCLRCVGAADWPIGRQFPATAD